MKTPVKVTLITVAVVVALILAAVIYVLVNQRSTPSPGGEGEPASVVRPNSHVLDEGGESAVTVVEFLDFECEACSALHPVVQDVREHYRGKINYVLRHFPLSGHPNAVPAALAVEAAAQQGQVEAMAGQDLDQFGGLVHVPAVGQPVGGAEPDEQRLLRRPHLADRVHDLDDDPRPAGEITAVAVGALVRQR